MTSQRRHRQFHSEYTYRIPFRVRLIAVGLPFRWAHLHSTVNTYTHTHDTYRKDMFACHLIDSVWVGNVLLSLDFIIANAPICQSEKRRKIHGETRNALKITTKPTHRFIQPETNRTILCFVARERNGITNDRIGHQRRRRRRRRSPTPTQIIRKAN